VFHLQVDIVGALVLNASLLLVLMTDYSDWLVQDTELIDGDESYEFWVIIRLFNVEKRFILECFWHRWFA